MAYERFKAIVDPLSRLDSTVTKARLKWLLPLTWFTGAAGAVAYMPFAKYDEQTGQRDYSAASWIGLYTFSNAWTIAQFAIPSISMLMFYGRIIYATRKQDNALGPQAEAERARRKARKNIMWIVVAVTLIYYFCCGFPQILYVGFAMHKSEVLFDLPVLESFILLLLALNSAFNPFVYFVFVKSFQDGLKQVFRCSRLHGKGSGKRNEAERAIHFQNMYKMNIRGHNSEPSKRPQLLAFKTLRDSN